MEKISRFVYLANSTELNFENPAILHRPLVVRYTRYANQMAILQRSNRFYLLRCCAIGTIFLFDACNLIVGKRMGLNDKSHGYVMRIEGEYNFTRDPVEILNALLDSKQNQTMIGLAIPAIGTGVFITSIEEIFLNDVEPIVQLKYLDVNGRLIEKTKFYLKEIIGACPLHSKWVNPLLRDHLMDNLNASEY